MSRHTPLANWEAHHSSFAAPVGVGSPDPGSALGNPFVFAGYRGTFLVLGDIGVLQVPSKNVVDPYGLALAEEAAMAVECLTQPAVESAIDGDCSAAAVVEALVVRMDPRTATALDK